MTGSHEMVYMKSVDRMSRSGTHETRDWKSRSGILETRDRMSRSGIHEKR